eukprot:TRINITY_DN1506_c0_g2_i2.p1 TRINITY_DN1506_c0_g2~~TRINITY_DN1506_c0_g2_i2.p1  ORF type:complete len:468 (-),score=116.61 TRINITY_DN1506_c0_g2_i2:1130-2533(-)
MDSIACSSVLKLREHATVEQLEELSLDDLSRQFLHSEQDYVYCVLKPLVEFSKRLRLVTNEDEDIVDSVFANIDDIYAIHSQLLLDMKNTKWFVRDLGKIFLTIAPYMRLYTDYFYQFATRLANNATLEVSNPKYSKLAAENLAATNVKIDTLLDIPLIRFRCYAAYLEALAIKLPPIESLSLAAESMKQAVVYVDLQVQEKHNRDEVVNIQNEFFKNQVALVDPARLYIDRVDMLHVERRGSCSLFSGGQARKNKVHVILFNDVLIISNGAKVKEVLRLSCASIEMLAEGENMFELSYLDEKILLESYTEVLCRTWFEKLDGAIKAECGSLIGAHISEDEFKAMILKKIPQVPLVDPEHLVQFQQAAKEISDLRRSSTTDSSSSASGLEEKNDDLDLSRKSSNVSSEAKRIRDFSTHRWRIRILSQIANSRYSPQWSCLLSFQLEPGHPTQKDPQQGFLTSEIEDY